jgi:two-component system, cell cycle sensor histidine kinase and response regulator CckA
VVSQLGTKAGGSRPRRAVDLRPAPIDLGDAQSAAITHDVNNLLTAILGHAEVALADSELLDSARADVLEIVKAARQAMLLTRQLAALRRPSADRSIVDLRTVVGAMGRMLWPLIGEGIELRTESGSRPIRVEADPIDLEGIILNLAINARDAMTSGGVLTLATSVLPGAGGRRAGLSVADTGSGMDATTQARAFDPYFSTKGPGRGSGLGLASVAETVRRNGWTMLVDTEPGRGSRFTVTIPLAPRGSPG